MSTVATSSAAPGATTGGGTTAAGRGIPGSRWRPVFEHYLTEYRRIWRGTVTTTVLSPVLYLLAMGVGLGHYVHGGSGHVDGVRYIQFLAPGLLAATAMTTAIAESTWPVMDSVKWHRLYFAMLASPLDIDDIVLGHFAFMAMRVAMTCVAFGVVVAAFGLAVHLAGLVLAVLCATLTGLAFAAPVQAFSVTVRTDTPFALIYRLGLIPLFLFSGTFYPLRQLPSWLHAVAEVTPLYQGVALCRGLTLGTGHALPDLGHVGYLVALTVAGLLVAQRTYRRRLQW